MHPLIQPQVVPQLVTTAVARWTPEGIAVSKRFDVPTSVSTIDITRIA